MGVPLVVQAVVGVGAFAAAVDLGVCMALCARSHFSQVSERSIAPRTLTSCADGNHATESCCTTVSPRGGLISHLPIRGVRRRCERARQWGTIRGLAGAGAAAPRGLRD